MLFKFHWIFQFFNFFYCVLRRKEKQTTIQLRIINCLNFNFKCDKLMRLLHISEVCKTAVWLINASTSSRVKLKRGWAVNFRLAKRQTCVCVCVFNLLLAKGLKIGVSSVLCRVRISMLMSHCRSPQSQWFLFLHDSEGRIVTWWSMTGVLVS